MLYMDSTFANVDLILKEWAQTGGQIASKYSSVYVIMAPTHLYLIN
jgi:hypothetical protein